MLNGAGLLSYGTPPLGGAKLGARTSLNTAAGYPTVNAPTPTVDFAMTGSGNEVATVGGFTLTTANQPASVATVRGPGRSFTNAATQRMRCNGTTFQYANTSFGGRVIWTPVGSADQVVLSTISASGGTGTFAVYWSAGSAYFGVTAANGSFLTLSGSGAQCEQLASHELNFTWDHAAGVGTIAVDGAYSKTFTAAANQALQTGSANFTVGAHDNGDAPANGIIGRASLWFGNGAVPSATQFGNIRQNGRSRIFTGSAWQPNDTTQYPLGRLANMAVASPRTIILDTDIGEDIGDLKALYLAIQAHKQNQTTLAGVVVTTTIDKGAACAWVLGNYAGVANTVPVYAYQGGVANTTEIVDNYANATATQFGNTTSRANFPSSTAGLSTLLSAAADGSVTYIVVGFGAAANQFVQSGAGNKTLFNQKVGVLVLAAGQFTAGPAEYNLYQDSANWTQFLANTTMARLWSPYTFGCLANTGTPIGNLNSCNPLRYANLQFANAVGQPGNASITRPMWDELALVGPVYGTLNLCKFSLPDITNTVLAANGVNNWTNVAGNDTAQLPVRSSADYTAFFDAKYVEFS